MEWLYGLVGVAFLGLVGLVWNLLNDKIKEHKDHCDDEIKRLWDQIGRDSFSGMRKIVHEEAGSHVAIMELDKRVDVLERHEAGNR
jgi:hypothetical protein